MRYVTTVPAKQMQSVSQRYRGVLDRSCTQRRRYWWWGLEPVRERGRGLDAEDSISRRQRVEAILLLAREPINSRKLAQYARLSDGTEARTLVRQLNACYEEGGRAFRVEEIGGGFRLLTQPAFAPWVGRLEHVPAQVRLSAPAMETLAVVAYRQPVLRAEVEAIRGVSCGEILRQLMDRELVRIGGRSDELGRPYLYTTTKRFLELFGLRNIDDLPRSVALGESEESPKPAVAECPTVPRSTEETAQEKSQVSVTSPTEWSVHEFQAEVSSARLIAPQDNHQPDNGENGETDDYDEDDYDDYDDDEDDGEDYDEAESDEDEFVEGEWEEVDDEDYEEDEDEPWDDDEDWDDDEEWDDEEEEEDEEEDWY
ncbi:MAG: SMC-Scp complex subunit ScpB [Planctomycetota bacterium]